MLTLEAGLFTNMYDYFTAVTKITVGKNICCVHWWYLWFYAL